MAVNTPLQLNLLQSASTVYYYYHNCLVMINILNFQIAHLLTDIILFLLKKNYFYSSVIYVIILLH